MLPYQLTQGQESVLGEIFADMASGERMIRLLQGDVGSGKSIVALLAMLRVVEAGHQAAIMAPTEILARQHFSFFAPLLEKAGLRVRLLLGSVKGREREQALAELASGEVHMAIGTHALFQSDVQFKKLALAVIDEQHRFGVAQRAALAEKGQAPHLLLMTATPIPRTLTMTAYGDMDTSILSEKPPGRQKIATRAMPLSRLHEVVDGLKRAISGGQKIYWICPLVEESEEMKTDLAAAEERYRQFQTLFGHRVGMVHGRMKGEARDKVMQGFAGTDFDILVATTVIEVGVNVPDATVMIIEHADRFGLSQLHQLRGRVGRGDKTSSCLLLYHDKISDFARERLRVIRESDDGFFIAEEDLRLRGAGEVLGTRQSGLPDFHFADLQLHADLVRTARDDVKLILHRDALLQSERGQALRTLLYLFEYDAHIRYLAS